ncbi:tetratricopeptide repeat protein [Glaciecola sp. MF2-115]|uniref:tetratricopeptide repeat protein n=1 Tax=Glaciecola sp. MF2-115 TaxID=3384827 RepID=UPI0039A17718
MSVIFHFKRIFILTLAIALFCTGCVSSKQNSVNLVPAKQLLNDAAFTQFDSYAIERPADIFFLDEDALAFIAESTTGLQSDEERIARLIHRIFARSELDLIYEASANTVASETFKNASANCLSLSIMTYAMAKQAGFRTDFQIVDIPEYWTRRAGYSLLNGHINLRIQAKIRNTVKTFYEDSFVVDFDPPSRSNRLSTSYVSEQTVLAMFYNNKGADALLKQNDELAYAYLREAVLADDSYAGAWVNLGLLYRKKGLTDLAMRSYKRAINLDDDYSTAWENLAVLYQQLGDVKAASEINARLEAKRNSNPFYHQMLAEIDRDEGRLDNSILHYEKAIKLNDKQHQLYYGLAAVYFQKGDLASSQRFLKLAKRKAGKSRAADIYLGKLSALSSYISSTEHN